MELIFIIISRNLEKRIAPLGPGGPGKPIGPTRPGGPV